MFKKCPVVASAQYAENNSSLNIMYLNPPPSVISKQQLPVLSTVNSEVHIERLWDLFEESHEIIHATISQVARQIIRLNRLCTRDDAIVNCLQAEPTKTCVKQIIRLEQTVYQRRRHCQLFAGRAYKNVCKTSYDVVSIP